MTNGVVDSSGLDSLAAGGGFAELDGVDAQSKLADALVRSTVQLTAEGMREAMFILEACGPDGVVFLDEILKLKNHQSAGATKRFVEAIKSLSLYEHLKGFNLNLGGK